MGYTCVFIHAETQSLYQELSSMFFTLFNEEESLDHTLSPPLWSFSEADHSDDLLLPLPKAVTAETCYAHITFYVVFWGFRLKSLYLLDRSY